MRICIILDRMNPNIAQAVRLLSERGVKVELIHPEKQLISLSRVRVESDLYLLKSGSDLALSLAGALHALGAATLNPYPTVAMMRNKIVVTRVLQAAGVPTPDSYLTAKADDLVPLLEAGPLIIKPYQGSRGEGIRIVRHVRELAALSSNAPIMAQRYVEPDGRDLKIFCIGARLFGVRRIWPLRTYQDKVGDPFRLSPELRQIARRCGRAFGIDLFGMDVVLSSGRPYVVDVNKSGSFMGVPDAPGLLAEHIYAACRRITRGEPLRYAADAT
ncbi:MAG: ATP-grasp domain-containing protein [Deltaproteobacteria bacterium]|nr:MAG: ATP-grasp domain-containing protein [Deltaproteobacteria bacterium]